MCFSASASFGASAFLTVIGVFTMKQVRQRNQIPAAMIPFFFAIQQAVEGVVWLSFDHAAFEPWKTVAVYCFLFFAFVIWPVWIPASVWSLERKPCSRFLPMLTALGALISLYLFVGLCSYDIETTVLSCHIRYDLPLATYNVYVSSLLYALVTILPFFFGRTRYLTLGGILGFGSWVISYLFYHYAFISVWCFFAALISALTLFIIHSQRHAYDDRLRH